MKILVKKRIPLRFLPNMLKTAKLSWDWSSLRSGSTPFEFNLRILYSFTTIMMRSCNFICLAIDENGVCVGFNMAYIAGNARIFHPFFFILNKMADFLLLFSGRGKTLRKNAIMIENNLYMSTRLGLYALAGADYKDVSVGICVAVNPDCRNRGIYKDSLKIILSQIKEYFLFQTSTHCDYKAHEKMGFKLLCTFPQPLNDGQSFIMYCDKSLLEKIPD